MTTAPYKLKAWDATEPPENASARLAEAMAAFGFPARIWWRYTVHGEGRKRSGFIERGTASIQREQVWEYMRRPRGGHVLSYPEIARACGMPAHSTILMAVRRAQRRAEHNGGGK